MTISRFINKFILFSLIFSVMQPVIAMDETTNITFGSRLKSFITSPKTVTFLSLCALGGYGYKTGNWGTAAGLFGTTFALYKIFDYRRNMAWRAELENLIPKIHEYENSYDLNNIIKAIELLDKINDKKLNFRMSYWTCPIFKKVLKDIVDEKNAHQFNKEIITNLLPIIKKGPLKTHILKAHINELYEQINYYNSATFIDKTGIDREIKEKHNQIKDMLLPY